MITRDSLKDHFEELGIELTGDRVLDKCVEICILRNIDEEAFVETWMAYSLTKCSGDPPTLETIDQMIRSEFAKKDTSLNTPRQPTTPLIVYNANTSTNSMSNNTEQNFNTTPKSKGDRNLAKGKGEVIARSPRNIFSPASYSPRAANPSSKYTNRTNAGQSVCVFGEHGEGDVATWKSETSLALDICPYGDEPLLAQHKVMLEPLSDKAAILREIILRVGGQIVETHGLEKPLTHSTRSHSECVCLGRICCDSGGHLNASSVLLECSNGLTMKVDLSKIAQYATFPGQIVAVEGTNPTGKVFLAQKLYSSAVLPSPQLVPQFTGGTLQIVIACGPFTQTDSLTYQPMEDLVAYIGLHKPHVVVLIGPLVNASHPLLVDGSLAETFEELHDKIISGIMEPLKGSWTKVVIVSSHQDGLALPIFPTPPPLCKHNYPNLTSVSDPSVISISGLVVGLTATDSLMHLGKEEIAFPGGSDRLGRLSSHLLEQQSFYPLYPSNEDLAVDSDLWDSHAFLPTTPHILVIPSDLRYFIKLIHGCVVINPERLARGQVGGSFVRVEVQPETDGVWSPATHISAQVVKI